MSAEAQGQCWGNLDGLTPAQCVVLLAVADVVNDAHDNRFYMRSKALAAKVGMHPRNVRHRLAELVDLGWVAVIDAPPGAPVEYRWMGVGRQDPPGGREDPGVGSTRPTPHHSSITQPNSMETQPPDGGDSAPPVGPLVEDRVRLVPLPLDSRHTATRDASRAPAPTLRVAIPNGWLDVTADFDGFWRLYPRKTGKGSARRAWDRVTRPPRNSVVPVPPAAIIEAVARVLPTWVHQEVRFIPYPATWLNQERWDDVPDATVERSRRRAVDHAAEERAARGLSLASDPATIRDQGAIDV